MVSVDLQLSQEEKKVLQDLKIGAEGVVGNFLYWGSVDNETLPLNLKSYIGTIGENNDINADVISKLIIRIAKYVTQYFNTEFAWIETKTFLANNTFIIPRWHIEINSSNHTLCTSWYGLLKDHKLVLALRKIQWNFQDLQHWRFRRDMEQTKT